MKKVFVRLLIFCLVIGLLIYYTGLKHSAPVSAPGKRIAIEGRPDLTAIFNNGNYSQYIDQFGTVARTAFDASGKRIGTQVATYRRGATNEIVVEMTYLEPDAEHPFGQAFDGAGNPKPLTTGPRVNHT
jgi:hypothetical protein